MRMLVLGAGLQGSACAYDLLQQPDVERVTLGDLHPHRLPPFLKSAKGRSRRLQLLKLNAKSTTALARAIKGHDAVMCALPYYFNYEVSRAAIRAGAHHTDLGGNTAIVVRQKRLDAQARRRGVSVIPDCGLAPGMVNILAAEGIRRVGEAEKVKIFVGGLPQHPEPPLNYQIVYSMEGVLDYYTTPSWVLREGRPARVDALSELEELEFPAPVGRLEAFHTGGGISTLPWAYAGKVRTMEYKTLRYPGHAAAMRTIRELGLLDSKAVGVKGMKVVPRDVFIATVGPHLTKAGGRDLVALRVEVTGRNGRRAAWELLDRYDERRGISAMMRTTGYSLAITGLMQADGRITERGVRTPDEAVPFKPYVDELKKRGVEIREIV
jgi:lysine 6-dehydrogenase